MRVEVVRARAEDAEVVVLKLPAGATVRDAIAACGLPGADLKAVGLFGKRVGADTALRDGDRVEIYRPLRVDPKEARRARARRR